MRFILGSGSPRRRALLGRLGIPFEIMTADVDEDVITVSDPAENVMARARLKAEALVQAIADDALILTVDTTVTLDGEMLNKPESEEHAREMLKRLRGRAHQVFTGFGFAEKETSRFQWQARFKSTDVIMRPYTDAEIDQYIATGDPMDKAGAYAIQHAAFQPVERIHGCYTSVVGLPVCEIQDALSRRGLLPQALQIPSLGEPATCALCVYST